MDGKRKGSFSSLKMLEKREIGQQHFKQDTLTSKYYKHFKMSWSQGEAHGAIFNLEFSPSGKMLVAACEASAILLYDPKSRKCLHRLPNAHNDSVNCICFCDERIFASGSDDCTIALWDTRMLQERVMKLSGHTGWVKSLVYDRNTELLLSSAFEGTIRTWDINRSSCSEEDLSVGIHIHEDNVSRMQLTPEGDKLIISCPDDESNCDIIQIFHNLNLPNLANDLDNLLNQIPTEYQLGGDIYSRNMRERLNGKLEYHTIPRCIPSFAVHPDGSSLVSRYMTMNNLQFTTVHDIQSCSYGEALPLNYHLRPVILHPGVSYFVQCQMTH